MNGILTMNQSIFGNKFEARRISKNARKVMASEMYTPTNSVEMTCDEKEYVDGGKKIGTYSYSDNTDAYYLACEAKIWAIDAGLATADGILYTTAGLSHFASLFDC